MKRVPFRKGGIHNSIVIVGASLSGLYAAQTLRAEGFLGRIVLIGDEPYLPYDRPPLSKGVMTGKIPASHTDLPRFFAFKDVEWRLGVAATYLDLANGQVGLRDGKKIAFDRLLIATGARARNWPHAQEMDLDGVFTLRGRDDAEKLARALTNRPKRVLIIGGGFTGSEIASACRERGLSVTLVERGKAPLSGALGGFIASRVLELQREHGVDVRCEVNITSLNGDAQGKFCSADLSDGNSVKADLAIVALGSIRNYEWLQGSGLAVGSFGVACDAGCRVFGDDLIVTDDIFVAGDIARFPHPVFDYQFLSLEHWGNAVEQAQVAAHNMICAPAWRRSYLPIPSFWSSQFGINIKSVGVLSSAHQVVISQGSFRSGRFVAVYGREGRVYGAVSFNHGRWLEYYRRLIEQGAAFPPPAPLFEEGTFSEPVSAEFPDNHSIVREATAILTGYDPGHRRIKWVPRSDSPLSHFSYPAHGQ